MTRLPISRSHDYNERRLIPKDMHLLLLEVELVVNKLDIKIPQRSGEDQAHLHPSQTLSNAISWTHEESIPG